MKEIKLTQNKVALVDDEDYEYLNQFKWYAKKDKYTYYAGRGVRYGNKVYQLQMHRIIMNTLEIMEIDHKDHNGLNNQKSNLRICTRSQNNKNVMPWGKSKYLGVCFSNSSYKDKTYTSIQSRIRVDGKIYHLGASKTEVQAARRYDAAALYFHNEFANLNFKEAI